MVRYRYNITSTKEKEKYDDKYNKPGYYYILLSTNNLYIISKYLRQLVLLLYRVRGCVVGSVRKKKERKKERERESRR